MATESFLFKEINNINELQFLVDKSSDIMKINYIGIQSYLTKAIQELHEKVLTRQNLIDNLKNRINLLKNK